jgi:23S rRNA pseudouridine1911/1915/1917 synthase
MKQLDKENYLNVQYLDNHILVVLKESNLLTQADKNNKVSLEVKAKKWIKDKYNKKDNVFLHPIHRLDKEVAGLVLFARTSKALSRLNEQMRENKIIRKYIAEIEGHLQEQTKELKDYLVHLSHRAKVVKKDEKKSKLAHLSYKVLKEKKDSSIIEIELFTGRYHQIRVQMSNLGHPIVGDRKYNSQKELKKINLQCCYLEFFHPIKNEKIKIEIKPFFEKL